MTNAALWSLLYFLTLWQTPKKFKSASLSIPIMSLEPALRLEYLVNLRHDFVYV